jgi:hypothetical protein
MTTRVLLVERAGSLERWANEADWLASLAGRYYRRRAPENKLHKELAAADLTHDSMQFVIVEHFHGGDPVPVYRRFRDRGRLAPEGLQYISSWVSTDLTRCYQIMECEDRKLLDQWLANWSDIVEFEVIPVITSAEAAAAVAPRL